MRQLPTLLLALFVVACGPTSQVAATPTPAPGQTPTDEPTFGPTVAPFGSFTRLDSFPATGAFEVTHVTSGPSGYVAVGFGGLDGDTYFGLRQGIIWTSADGVDWTELVDPSLAYVTPTRIVVRGSDMFLLGYLSDCSQLAEDCTDVAQAGNGVWRSTNGGAWQLLPQLADMQLGETDDMFAAADRLVVVGSGSDDNASATMWTSPDGSSWTATTDLAGVDQVSSMAAGPAGFSAFGTRYDDSIDDVLMIAAHSTDGVHFSPASVPQMGGSGIDDVAVGQGGMAGVGYHADEALDMDGVAVHSSDGLTWSAATNSDGTFAGSALLTVAGLAGGGYVAVGYTPSVEDFTLQRAVAWFSTDGSDWQRISVLDGTFSLLSTSALGSPGLVVFAAEQVDVDEDNVSSIIHAWFAPLSSLHG